MMSHCKHSEYNHRHEDHMNALVYWVVVVLCIVEVELTEIKLVV